MKPVQALKEVDLSIAQGEMVAVIGPSGSGKSTLLQMMGALDVPSEGEVRVNFEELSKMSAKELTIFRSQTVGFVFKKFNLIPNLTALENVSIAMNQLTWVAKKGGLGRLSCSKKWDWVKELVIFPGNFRGRTTASFYCEGFSQLSKDYLRG